MNTTPTKLLAKITSYPPHPIIMLRQIIERNQTDIIPMNLATVDKEFGVLNRTVMFRGIIDNSSICFVTERNSRKFRNLMDNPKLSLSFLMPLNDCKSADGKVLPESWQVRLFDAVAVELNEECIRNLWKEEPLFAKVRSHISECGRPQDPKVREAKCTAVLESMKTEGLKQTQTYTAFKVIGKCWDFYKGEPDKIADRIQYRMTKPDQWEVHHVDA